MAQTKKGKESAFQARDSTFHKGSGEVPKKKNSSKAHSKKEYGATFGQNVQKSDAEPGAKRIMLFLQKADRSSQKKEKKSRVLRKIITAGTHTGSRRKKGRIRNGVCRKSIQAESV